MERKLVKIGVAAELLGTTPATLRKWEASGELLPARKTKGGARYYALADLLTIQRHDMLTVGYARIASPERKAHLKQQQELLEHFCAAQGWPCTVITDCGAGLNYRNKGLRQLLELITCRRMHRLVITHTGRLLRLGAEFIFTLCELHGVEVVILNQGSEPDFEDELTQDVLEMVAIFTARLYGARHSEYQQMLAALKNPARG